jgi:hypothetical protein
MAGARPQLEHVSTAREDVNGVVPIVAQGKTRVDSASEEPTSDVDPICG